MGNTNDSIHLLMQEVVLTSIRDYSSGKMSRLDMQEWLDEDQDIIFIASCLEMTVENLCEFITEEMEKCDNRLASLETLSI